MKNKSLATIHRYKDRMVALFSKKDSVEIEKLNGKPIIVQIEEDLRKSTIKEIIKIENSNKFLFSLLEKIFTEKLIEVPDHLVDVVYSSKEEMRRYITIVSGASITKYFYKKDSVETFAEPRSWSAVMYKSNKQYREELYLPIINYLGASIFKNVRGDKDEMLKGLING